MFLFSILLIDAINSRKKKRWDTNNEMKYKILSRVLSLEKHAFFYIQLKHLVRLWEKELGNYSKWLFKKKNLPKST